MDLLSGIFAGSFHHWLSNVLEPKIVMILPAIISDDSSQSYAQVCIIVSAGVVDAQQLGLGGVSARGNCHRHREEEENLKYHDRQVEIILSLSFGSVQKRLRAVAFVWMNIMACIGIELRPSKRLKCPSRF